MYDDNFKVAKLIRNHKHFNSKCLAKVLWCLCKEDVNSVHAIRYLLDDQDCDVNQDFEDSTPLLMALERVDDVGNHFEAADALLRHERVKVNKSWSPLALL